MEHSNFIDSLLILIRSKLESNNTATIHYTGPKKLHDGNVFIFAKSSDGRTEP